MFVPVIKLLISTSSPACKECKVMITEKYRQVFIFLFFPSKKDAGFIANTRPHPRYVRKRLHASIRPAMYPSRSVCLSPVPAEKDEHEAVEAWRAQTSAGFTLGRILCAKFSADKKKQTCSLRTSRHLPEASWSLVLNNKYFGWLVIWKCCANFV